MISPIKQPIAQLMIRPIIGPLHYLNRIHFWPSFLFLLILFSSGCTSLQSTRINTDPTHSANMLDNLEKANTAYESKKWSQAEMEYRKIVKVMSKDEFSYFRLGNTLLWQGRLTEALDFFKKAIELNPQFNEARHNLATTYILLAEEQMAALEDQAQPEQKKSIRVKREHLNNAASTPL